MNKRVWWLVVGAIAGGAIAFGIAWALAAGDIDQAGDWRHGALRFIGSVTAIGAGGGYIIARQLAGRSPVTRDGFTLSYGRIEPRPDGYREMTTARIGDLVSALKAVGYDPTTARCDDTGAVIGGPLDLQEPLAGANVAIRDAGVRGWIRLQLAQPIEGQKQSLGLLEVWSKSGDSTEELALFTLRALDTLLDNLTAGRESSVLSNDDAALLTAGLGDRPMRRKV